MKHRHAFTLVELSIVLVILGLLVGGVLSGQSLIHAAELRKITSNLDRYQTAIHTFRDKYHARPGDIANATAFWPQCTTHPDNAGYTCNGNNDGQLQTEEGARVFEHLTRAGLVEGQFDVSTADINGDPAVYNPQLYPLNSLIGYSRIDNISANEAADGFATKPGDVFSYLAYPEFGFRASTEDLYTLDRKMDDGNGRSGSFQIYTEEMPADGCVDITSGEYLPQNDATGCAAILYGFFS